MRTEASVSPTSRYLWLVARLSAERFSASKHVAIRWCQDNPLRLNPANQTALLDLKTCELNECVTAVVIYSCYADIPENRTYSAVFDFNNPAVGFETEARLRFGIFWRHLPTRSLEHGHHQVVILEFPKGVPGLLKSLPIFKEGDKMHYERSVGLCDYKDWKIICARGRDA